MYPLDNLQKEIHKWCQIKIKFKDTATELNEKLNIRKT